MLRLLYITIGILLLPLNIAVSLLCILFFILGILLIRIPFVGQGLLAISGVILYPLTIYTGFFWFFLGSEKITLTDEFIQIHGLKSNTLLPWHEIAEIKYIFQAPWYSPCVVLKDGTEHILLNVNTNELHEFATKKSITFNKLGKS